MGISNSEITEILADVNAISTQGVFKKCKSIYGTTTKQIDVYR